MTGSPVCSVIIPSYRSQDTIAACLSSLQAQDFDLPYEIIVVDSSPDRTPDIVRRDFPQVRLFHLEQQTEAAQARNLGAHQAQGEVLAFLDSDCLAPTDWLRRLYGAILSGWDAAGGAIDQAGPRNAVTWAGYLIEFREFLPTGEPRPASNLTLGNAAYRRGRFWQAGGFPTGCFPQEDQVFNAAFIAAGGAILYDPGIVVSHHHRSQLGDFLEHQRRIGVANARVVARLNLPGSGLVRRPHLARLAHPALAALRLGRTIRATWVLAGREWLRQPALLWTAARGMLWWGRGFYEGAQAHIAPSMTSQAVLAPSPAPAAPTPAAIVPAGTPAQGLVPVTGLPSFEEKLQPGAQAGQAAAGHAHSDPQPAAVQAPPSRSERASIVVCTRERPELLKNCLEALRPLADAGHEVLVVDNAPVSDETARLVSGYPYRYLVEPVPGLNHARNLGLAAAWNRIIAYTDDDCSPQPDWADALVRALSTPGTAAATGLVLPLEPLLPAQQAFEDYCANRRIFHSRTFKSPPIPPAAAGAAGMGANMAFHRAALDDVGGFDVRFDGGAPALSGGDTEIFARLLSRGWQIIYTPQARVFHHHPADRSRVRRVVYGYGVGLYAFLTKRLVEDHDHSVPVTALRWLAGPPVKALWNRLRRRPAAAWDIVFVELAGSLVGPFRYWRTMRGLPPKGAPPVRPDAGQSLSTHSHG